MARYGASSTLFPDWIMLGVADNDGVTIYASRELLGADIRMETDQVDVTTWGGDRQVIPGLSTYYIDAVMGRVFMARGRTYAEAFSNLFADWAPDAGPRNARPLPEPVTGLPGSRPELGR